MGTASLYRAQQVLHKHDRSKLITLLRSERCEKNFTLRLKTPIEQLSENTQNFLIYFLLTGSKVDTPATATPIAVSTTPPATTLRSRFFNDGDTPGCAASAISGTTAAASRARLVRPATLLSDCEEALQNTAMDENSG